MAGATPTPAAGAIDPGAHVDWAQRVGAGIAKHYGFRRRSPAWEDIRAEAVVVVFEKARQAVADGGFDPRKVPPGGDPAGLFRGWAHPSVRGRCVREAKRQRNGGTYHTSKELERAGARQVEVSSLSVAADNLARLFGTADSDTGDFHARSHRWRAETHRFSEALALADPDDPLEFDPPPPESVPMSAALSPPGVPLPGLEAERTVLAARLSALDELKRHLTGLVTLVSADPALLAVAAAELKAVLQPKGKREAVA